MSLGPSHLRSDLPAGLAVFLVAVPLCLGVAHASGAPPQAGLLAGVIGAIVVGSLGGSQLLVGGPAAGLATVVYYGAHKLGGFSAFLTALVLAGLAQMLFGLMRAGLVARLFPTAVVRGMMSGIGLIMIYKQIPHLLGYDQEVFGAEAYRQGLVSAALASVTWPPLAIGLLCLTVMIVWELWFHRRFPALPGAVLAVALGLGLQQLLQLSAEHRVDLPANWLTSIPTPAWAALADPQTWILALTLALVASVEALLTAEAIDRLDPEHRATPPNRELLAQGFGNVLCGLLGALPLTGVIMRSSVNVAAGARTRVAAISSGVFLLLAALFAQPLLASIPLAALAAVLVVVGAYLVRPAQIVEIFRQGPGQAVPFSLTAAGIVLADLHTGILLGLASSALFILRDQYRSHGFEAERQGRILEIKLGAEVGFFHKAALLKVLEEARPGELVVIDGTHSRFIHYDVIEALQEFRQRAPFRQIWVSVGGVPGIPSHSEEHLQMIEDQYRQLIENNREWVAERLAEDPAYFENSSQGQTPTFLFIGCSDSRVPAETITKTDPGMLFVHRNIANVVSLQDVNLMSVLQYSVEHLKVPHIIVCGHYGCGGVRAALSNSSLGLIDNWITPIKQTYKLHHDELSLILDPKQRERRVIELHVIQQVRNLLKTSIVQNTQKHFGRPQVHGWVYDLETGLINDLKIELNVKEHLHPVFHYE